MPLRTLRPEDVVLTRQAAAPDAVRRRVAEIIEAVRLGHDDAVRTLTRDLDGVDVPDCKVPKEEIAAALEGPRTGLRDALETAAARVRAVCQAERPPAVVEVPVNQGVKIRLCREPLRRVAVYVPAGRAPLPSSVIMGVTPAQVAGVPEVLVLTPPGKDGRADRTTLAACALLGVEEVYLVGGAQAVAAAAYGTDSIRRVEKLVGPGNAWVTEAKRQLQGVIGIDGLNGPSEVMIWAEPPAPAEQLALDLLAQAEHDPASWAVFVTSSRELLSAVQHAADRLARELGVEELLERPGVAAVLVQDGAAAQQLVQAFAPEHLEIWGAATLSAPSLRSAGATFIGCPTPLGDYAAGANHVLPTGGSARFASSLGVEDFLRRRTETRVTGDASSVVEAAVTLAGAEGLRMHRAALEAFQEVVAPWGTAMRSS